jgi:hypothetical protein
LPPQSPARHTPSREPKTSLLKELHLAGRQHKSESHVTQHRETSCEASFDSLFIVVSLLLADKSEDLRGMVSRSCRPHVQLILAPDSVVPQAPSGLFRRIATGKSNAPLTTRSKSTSDHRNFRITCFRSSLRASARTGSGRSSGPETIEA